jgi:asparagine synthase (glutamine-hydrolysing)
MHGKIDKPLISKMSEVLRHRGPDDCGFFYDDKIALGNTRLSIIDIKGGHQPVHNEDSTIWIVFNGEIYNFQELRFKLEKLGHEFYTDSDTEVVVHAYEQWKERCVNELNGMWAFAVWDSNRKALFLSRDRLGIKPLYYFSDGKRFIFASEIKAIIEDKSIPRVPNDEIIYEYLMYGLHDHTEGTFFSHINRLLPAHNLSLDESNVYVRKYWDIPHINKEIGESDKKDVSYARRFRELFQDSVSLQLIGEVPVGTCLSGGLDSSSIVCTINQLLSHNAITAVGERQKTFTVCFEDKQIDEREYVEEVIAQTRTEKNLVFPSSRELWKDIEELVFSQEEPFMSSSVYAQWCVMKLASKKVKVVLDGQGGDELLAGYEPYFAAFILDLWTKRRIVAFIKELLLSHDTTWTYAKQYLLSSYQRRLNHIGMLLDDSFASKFLPKRTGTSLHKELSDLLHQEITKTSLPRLLRYEDKNSMAFSVEARVPFLDHRLVEYVFSLPVNQRLKNGWTKFILRNAMKGIVPEKIRKRRRKIGFAVPEAAWLRELRREIREVLASRKFGERKYFNQEEVLNEFDKFCQGKSDLDANIFWHILNLEIWLRVFIDG